jgi:uncharacterized membrane protein YvlD (DUF360 family)
VRPLRLALGWIVAAAAVWVAAWILPGVGLEATGAAFLVAAALALLNAVLPPLLAALRLPFTLVSGFLLVLFADAALLRLAADILPDDVRVDSFGDALLAALIIAAVSVVLQVVLGTNDDDEYTLRVTQRIARRGGGRVTTDVPGLVFLEIDGLALPVVRDAMRDGSAPTMARWLAEGGYRLAEWEPDLSSQTGASQAGILLGSNEDIPAFRWVEKESGRLMTCSSPADCAEIERRHATGVGLLIDGGASRGNLLSGEAAETILTVSRSEAERRANPGYRAFLANGFNVTRALVLFGWEVVLELTAAARAARRDIRPRGHRGGIYPLMRAAMCVIVRDLIVFGVLTDMMRGRPPSTRRSQLRRGRPPLRSRARRHDGGAAQARPAVRSLERARRYAARPYELVVLSDHGQTQGATFKQRHGYGLDELVERALAGGRVHGVAGGDEQDAMVGHARRRGDRTARAGAQARQERRLRPRRRRPRLRQPRARLPDGRRAQADPRGDRRAPPRADPGPARAPAHRLAARALRDARRGRPRAPRRALPRRAARRGRGPARRVRADRRTPPGRAPTASRTSPTSWSAASTTRRSTRAARSRS